MDILQIVRTIDGGIAVAVLIVVWWRMENRCAQDFERLMSLINKLTDDDG